MTSTNKRLFIALSDINISLNMNKISYVWPQKYGTNATHHKTLHFCSKMYEYLAQGLRDNLDRIYNIMRVAAKWSTVWKFSPNRQIPKGLPLQNPVMTILTFLLAVFIFILILNGSFCTEDRTYVIDTTIFFPVDSLPLTLKELPFSSY